MVTDVVIWGTLPRSRGPLTGLGQVVLAIGGGSYGVLYAVAGLRAIVSAVAILAVGGGSYGVLYAVAGACAIVGAVTILPVKRVR